MKALTDHSFTRGNAHSNVLGIDLPTLANAVTPDPSASLIANGQNGVSVMDDFLPIGV